MSKTLSQIEDIPKIINAIVMAEQIRLIDTHTCDTCGCLRFPQDETCPGCKSALLLESKRRNYTP